MSVGNQTLTTLSTNVYNNTAGSAQYWTLTRVEYGNGGKVKYAYDDYKRVKGVRFDAETTDRFTYEYGANGQIGKVTDHVLNRETASEYDLANRPLKIVTRQGNLHVYTGSVGYDAYNNLRCFMEKVSTILAYYRTDYAYDRENKPTGLSYSDRNSLAYTYDGIGRMNKSYCYSYAGLTE